MLAAVGVGAPTVDGRAFGDPQCPDLNAVLQTPFARTLQSIPLLPSSRTTIRWPTLLPRHRIALGIGTHGNHLPSLSSNRTGRGLFLSCVRSASTGLHGRSRQRTGAGRTMD